MTLEQLLRQIDRTTTVEELEKVSRSSQRETLTDDERLAIMDASHSKYLVITGAGEERHR